MNRERDCGTENCYVAAIQCFFREGHGDVFAGDEFHVWVFCC